MTNEQTMTLVLKDTAGNYFLVSQAAVEQGRVPEERKAEIERLVAEADEDDVSGHAVMISGEWFTPTGDTHRTEIPPKYGPFGFDLDPPRLPRQPSVE